MFSSIDVYIYNSTFRDNFGTIGGVIDSQYYVTVTIEDSVFEGNIGKVFIGNMILNIFPIYIHEFPLTAYHDTSIRSLQS